MIKWARCASRQSWRYSAIVALSATMAACGGSSGTTGTETTTDSQGGFDLGGLSDFDLDGVSDFDDFDADGDGILDSEDNFVDLNNDGFDDLNGNTEFSEFENVSFASACGNESGSVASGEDADWDDNCFIRRSIDGGEFADSLYSVGIQRIIFCSGFDGDTGLTLTQFADGEYGPASEAALQDFQASFPNPLAADGIVGSNTWAKLQDAIVRLEIGESLPGSSVALDPYGFMSGPCAFQPLLYQTVTQDAQTSVFIGGGWRLARNPPASDETVPFSIALPFNRL